MHKKDGVAVIYDSSPVLLPWIIKVYLRDINFVHINYYGVVMMKLKNIRLEFIVVFAALCLLVYVLMLQPIIGVADNGDFGRIMGSTGLTHMTESFEELYFGYVNREYRVGIPIFFAGGYFSTEIFIVAAAVFISQVVNYSGVFDIRYLSGIYSLIFIAALFLIVLGIRKKWGSAAWFAAAASLLVFADIAYITYFNSLYGEAVTLVFLLLMTGAAIYMTAAESPKLWSLILFFLAAAFFAGAKVQNSPAGLLAVLLGFALIKIRRDKQWRRTIVFSAAFVIVISALSYGTISKDIKTCNKYQTVFYGILKDSPDPAADLAELGLNQDYVALAGTNYFLEEYPIDIRTQEFKKNIDENINHLKIAGFYLRHPHRLIKKLEVAALYGFKLLQGFGNYEKFPGIGYKTTADIYSFWSSFKLAVLPHSLFLITVFFLCFLIVLSLEYKRTNDIRLRFLVLYMAFIALTGATQFVMPIIGDGEADLSKHLFLFNVCFDIMFAASVVYCLYRALNLLMSRGQVH